MLTWGYGASMVFGFLATHFNQKFSRRQFYLVPFGNIEIAKDSTANVEWIVLHHPEMPDYDRHGAIVADLRHDHPPEWERMLASAAISGRVVYHTKQLHESLTGKVEIEHLSENSFGSLLPNLAYRKIKRAADIVVAAQDAGLASMKPGASAREVDALVRRPIRKIRPEYYNRTGYSTGIGFPPKTAEWEVLDFNEQEDWEIKEGMVFHMLALACGFGISETVAVTRTGIERLTPSNPRGLCVVQ
jgi:hypothetical protein